MNFDTLLNWDRVTAHASAPRLCFLNPSLITTISLLLAVLGLSVLFTVDGWAWGIVGAALIFAARWFGWIDGHVAKVTMRASTMGGLYNTAVGYLTMATAMAAIGYREDDIVLAIVGSGSVVLLCFVLMGCGWLLSRRQRFEVIQWNPQKFLLPRQTTGMRRLKSALDLCRNGYWIFAFALAGGSGLHAWGWIYTAVVFALTAWVAAASFIFVRRVYPAAPRHEPTSRAK